MCPRCQQTTLHSTGGFWICAACGLAITEQALAFERMTLRIAKRQVERDKENERDV